MGIHCPAGAEFKRSATQWIFVFAGMAKVFNFLLTLTTYHLTKLLFINIFDFFLILRIIFLKPKGFGFGTVRKSVNQLMCESLHIKSAGVILRHIMCLLLCHSPHGRGAVGYTTGVVQRPAGSLLIYDFLNPPDRQISLAAFFLRNQVEIGCFFY